MNEHAKCGCGSQQPAKHWDRLRREMVCDDCVAPRMNDTNPSFAGHPYGRFQRIYTQDELAQLTAVYPFEQRVQDLNRKPEVPVTAVGTDEWFPTCVICEQQIKRGPDGEAEWFILPSGAAICANPQCMSAIQRKPA